MREFLRELRDENYVERFVEKFMDWRLLGLYIFIILIYFLLIKEAYVIVVHTDLFEDSLLPKEKFLYWPLSLETAVWFWSFVNPVWFVLVVLYLSLEYSGKLGEAFSWETNYLSFIFIFLDVLTFILIGAFILRWVWGKDGALEVNLWSLLAVIVQFWAYISLGFLVYSIAGNFWSAIVGSFIYFLVEMYLRNMLFEANLWIGYLLPAKVITSLVFPPGVRYFSQLSLEEFLSFNPLPFWLRIFLGLVYVIVFFAVSRILYYKKFKNKTK